MATNIRVHFEVVPILSRLCKTADAFGYLLGHRGDETIEVISCITCQQNNNPLLYAAGGVEVVGWFYSGAVKLDTACVGCDAKKLQVSDTGGVICATTVKCQGVTDDNFFFLSDGGTVTKQPVTFTNEDILSNKLLARVACHIPISFDLDTKDLWKSSLYKEIDNLCQLTLSDKAVLHLIDSSVLLGACFQCGVTADTNCIDLYELVSSNEEFGKSQRKKSKKNIMDPLKFSMYFKLDGKSPVNNVPTCSPVLMHNIGNYKSVDLTLPVDVLAIVSPTLPVGELADILLLTVSNQLMSMSESLIIDTKTKKDKFCIPVPYHFQPIGMQMIFTVVYLKDLTEDELAPRRKQIHEVLGLTMDRPLFRRSNRILFPEEQSKLGYLINPHQGLSGSGLKGGKEYTVQGLYSYHHYMQDRFDDNKWGCAYRSLQTLVSWFRLQGYTDTAIPTHRQIQQALVDVGDKEAKFVGSCQWIGSMEVSYCLDHLLGVTSKIMFVSSGGELVGKGRELALHFQTQGTPIMIGGGVLAHTILGVDFNDVTGDVKFLILDPHYTGAEDLKVILDKGWCGWKGTDFWDQQAHYNLCMPQRPLVI